MQKKFIFVTGGVVSGLGKGITAASLGMLLKARGYGVTNQKFDPYINIDPGKMNPYEHGEVFVTDDGAETDLDLGHYERFTDESLTAGSSVTTGKIYWSVLNKERNGEYNGKTVQVIPHVTNEIKEMVYKASENAEIVITEIGGTVGDIEGLPFLEAIRQVAIERGRENVMYIHVTLVPVILRSGEMKSKPTQHSVKELLSIGIQPDMIVCRTEQEMDADMKKKIALFCNVPERDVIQNVDADSLYEVPILLAKEKFASLVCERLNIEDRKADLSEWEALISRQRNMTDSVTVALVGKYVELRDAYLSVVEALNHAGIQNGAHINVKWVNAEDLDGKTFEEASAFFAGANAVITPGGFGTRGIEGKIKAIGCARELKIPFLGICLGMQLTVIEYMRSKAGIADACSSEETSGGTPVIDLMPGIRGEGAGGEMRLGASKIKIKPGTLAESVYGQTEISERHRHKYELNSKYHDALEAAGMVISGYYEDVAEIIELPEHPFFVGVQFHPEFKSRPTRPHPLFNSLVKAAVENKSGI